MFSLQILAAYIKFLSEGELFYEALISHFKSVLQQSGNSATLTEDQDQNFLRTSLARCFICVGDLQRYGAAATAKQKPQQAAPEGDETTTTNTPSKLSLARESYAAAAAAFPVLGNAYNQLGVVDEQEKNAKTA